MKLNKYIYIYIYIDIYIYNLVFAGQKNKTIWGNVGCSKIWKIHSKKLIRAIIDRNLNFSDYVSSISKKASKKLSALARISRFLNFEQQGILMK